MKKAQQNRQQKPDRPAAKQAAAPPAAPRPAGSRKADLAILAVILLVGGALRAAFLAEMSKTPEFKFPPVDCGYHNYWATAMVTGNWTALPDDAMGRDPQIRSRPYFRPPGYPWFLALLYRVAGCNTVAARSLQMALGLVNVVLMFLLARATLGRAAGLLSAAFMSFYWLFIYFESQLEEPVLLIFLALSIMLVCLRLARRPSPAAALSAGILVGAFALARPNILLFAPVLALWIFAVARNAGRVPRRALLALLCAAGVALPVLPVTIRNRVAGRDSTLISANGGVNLYIGNNGFSQGQFVDDIPDLGHFRTCFDYPTIVANLEQQFGRPLKYSEVSRFYTRKALDFIGSRPLKAAGLTLRKAALFWSPVEITHNSAVAVEHQFSKVLRSLPGNFAFVLSLALVGAFSLWRRARRGDLPRHAAFTLALMSLFVLVYYASFVPFFVTSLYRVPITPFLLVAAAAAILHLGGLLARRAFAPAAGLAAAWLVLFAGLSAPLLMVTDRDKALNVARWHFAKGVTYTMTGEPEKAIQHYREAIKVDPGHARAHNNLAGLLLQGSDVAGARAHYETALQYNSGFEEALCGMGQTFTAQGRWSDAVPFFQRALAINPRMTDARFALANTLAQAGSFDAAAAAYREVLRERPNIADAHSNLGVVLASQNRYDEAISEYRISLGLNPGNATTYANMGLALEGAGKPGEAAGFYRQAFRLDPNNKGVQQRLSELTRPAGK